MPHDREAAVFLHPTCARNVAAIVALEHRTGMVAMVRPGGAQAGHILARVSAGSAAESAGGEIVIVVPNAEVNATTGRERSQYETNK